MLEEGRTGCVRKSETREGAMTLMLKQEEVKGQLCLGFCPLVLIYRSFPLIKQIFTDKCPH